MQVAQKANSRFLNDCLKTFRPWPVESGDKAKCKKKFKTGDYEQQYRLIYEYTYQTDCTDHMNRMPRVRFYIIVAKMILFFLIFKYFLSLLM